MHLIFQQIVILVIHVIYQETHPHSGEPAHIFPFEEMYSFHVLNTHFISLA